MAYIHGATFMLGTEPADVPRLLRLFGVGRAELFEAESPRHTVTLAPYYLDRKEVTNARFKKFVDRNPEWSPARIQPGYHNGEYLRHWTGGAFPKGRGDHPLVNVSWYAAVAFCRWEGKRLPTEAEWEYAARGGLEGRQFPWGDEMPDGSRANFRGSGLGTTVRVGSYAPNGYGLYDMAGNVWEFVADAWGPYPSGAQTAPLVGGELLKGDGYLRVTGRRVIRGGSWGGAPLNLRVAYRDSHPAVGAREFVGFRCAASAPSTGQSERGQ
jgi:sulfatase modifying factor 1